MITAMLLLVRRFMERPEGGLCVLGLLSDSVVSPSTVCYGSQSRRDTMPGEHKTILFVECHFCPRLFDMFGRARENRAFLVQT